MPSPRIFAREHAACRARESMADKRPRRVLFAEHVYTDGTGRRVLSHEADELSIPHSYLQELAQELSRSAGEVCGTGQRVSLRTLRHNARPAARAWLYAG